MKNPFFVTVCSMVFLAVLPGCFPLTMGQVRDNLIAHGINGVDDTLTPSFAEAASKGNVNIFNPNNQHDTNIAGHLAYLGIGNWYVSGITPTPGKEQAVSSYQFFRGGVLADSMAASSKSAITTADLVRSRMASIFDGNACSRESAGELGVWAEGFGFWSDAGYRKGNYGQKYKAAGAITGIDRRFGDFAVGLAGSYAAGTYEDKALLKDDSKTDSYSGNVYAAYGGGEGLQAGATLGFTRVEYDMRRLVGGEYAYSTWIGHAYLSPVFDTADYSVDTWLAGTNVGWAFRLNERFSLTPSAGLYYLDSRSERFSTTYLTLLEKMRNHELRLPLEVRLAYDLPLARGALRLSGVGGYIHRFKPTGSTAYFDYNVVDRDNLPLPSVKAVGRAESRHMWRAGASVEYCHGRFGMRAAYDYAGDDANDDHRATVKVEWVF